MTDAHLIVGVIIQENGKILMVQELKEKCYLKWNLPLGHLDYGEGFTEAAIREAKEETGYDVELTGLVSILNNFFDGKAYCRVVFSANIVGGSPDERAKDEINDVKFWTLAELEEMGKAGKLRGNVPIMKEVRKFVSGDKYPMTMFDKLIEKWNK